MRSDMRALFRIVAGAFVVAVLVMGLLAAAALGWLARDTAIGVALVGLLAGGVLLGRVFGRGLFVSDRPPARHAEPGAAPDPSRDNGSESS